MAKNRKQYDWFDLSSEDKSKWEGICPIDEYRIVPGTVLSGLLPDELVAKYDSVFIMASGTPMGNVYYMANGNRIDFPDNAIDQMPFGLAFVGDQPIASGCLIQHGDWSNRTTRPPAAFWNIVNMSGTPSNFPLSELPNDSAGSITDLKIKSQRDAFVNLVEALKDQVGE